MKIQAINFDLLRHIKCSKDVKPKLQETKVPADVLEAIIGAIFIDNLMVNSIRDDKFNIPIKATMVTWTQMFEGELTRISQKFLIQ